MRLRTSTAQLTEQIVKQEMTFGKMFQMMKSGGLQNSIRAIADEQLRLKNAMIIPDPMGKGRGYALVPKGLPADIKRGTAELGVFNDMLRSSSNHMLNWGKNMQWGGRQLTVGLTLPIAAAGAAMGKLAYDVDNSLGHLKAVYGDTAQSTEQLNEVSKTTMATAKEMASTWGVTAKDTIDLAASFAAAGKTGQDLQDITKQTTKIMVLGEVDREEAFKTTISVMQAFHLTATQLTDAFNHMNAVENQTVLTMQDMIAGIPRVAPVVAQLGGNIGDMNVLLTSMKAAGITAEQGSIAISRGLTSLIHPSNTAREELSALGINIDGIFEKHKGETMPILGVFRDLSLQMKDLTSEQQQAAIVTLFGKFQDPRITAMLDQLGLRTGQMSEQVIKAINAMGLSASDAAEVSAREQEQRMGTAAAKIKRTWATIQADLAEAGKPFLQVGGVILSILSKMIKMFTGLPGPVKTAFAAFAIGAAVVGPIVMMIGLFTNLIAQTIRLGVFLTGIATKWKTMTKEEILANITARNSIGIMEMQQKTMMATNVLLEQMAAGWTKAAAAEAVYGTRVGPSGTARRAGSSRKVANKMIPTTTMMPGYGSGWTQDFSKATAESGTLVANTRNWNSILVRSVGTLALVGGGVELLRHHFDGIGGAVSHLAGQLLLILPMVNLMGSGIAKAMGAARAGQVVGGMSRVLGRTGGSLAGRVLGLGGAGLAEGAGLGALGAGAAAATGVGVLAVGAYAGWKLWEHHQDEIAKRNKQLIADNKELATSSQRMGEIVGATWKQNTLDLSGYATELHKTSNDQVKAWSDAWKKNNASTFEALNKIKDDAGAVGDFIHDKLAEMQIHGATAEQMENAVQTMLRSIGRVDLRATIGDVTWTNKREAVEQVRKDFQSALNRNMKDFRVRPEVLYTQTRDSSKSFIDDVLQLNPTARNRELKKVEQYISGVRSDAIAAAKKYFSEDNAGWQTSASLQQFLFKALGVKDSDYQTIGSDMASGNIDKYIEQLASMPLKKLQEALDDSDLSGSSEKYIKNLVNIKRESVGFGHTLLDTTGILGSFGDGETNAAAALDFFSQSAAGADAAAASAGDSTDEMGKKARRAADDIQYLKSHTDDLASALKSNLQEGVSRFIDFGLGQFDRATSAYDDKLSEAQNKAVDKTNAHYDRLVKGGKKYGDARLHQINEEIAAVNKRSKAEQNAEEQRQRMFEAEQRRLQLEAQQQQTSVDYNEAMASGNLDEAARVAAGGVAADAQAALEDANARAQQIADQASKVSEKRLKELNKEKDQRIKALNEQRDKAIKAINAEYTARKKAYDDERAYQRQVLEDMLHRQSMYAMNTKGQYADMFDKLNGMLGKYGAAVEKGSQEWNYIVRDGWSRGMRDAAISVAQDNVWSKLGKNISDRVTQGALGMTWHEFMRYLITGKAPKEKIQTHGTGNAIRSGNVDLPPGMSVTNYERLTHHEGGPVQRIKKWAGLRSDEEPRILQHGEWVIQKDSVNKYGHAMMDALNRGILPGKMHSGGAVDAVHAAVAPGVLQLVNAMEMLIGNAAVRANAYWGSHGGDSILGGRARGRGGSFSGPMIAGAGARTIWDNLRAIGLTAVQAAGVMGNMQYESGFNPYIIQGGGTSMNPADAGGGGYGLVQWTPGSKLIPYLHGAKPSVATEIRALAEQLSGKGPSPESYAGQMLRSATSPGDAAMLFQKYYERPAEITPARADLAESIFEKYQKFDMGGWLKPGVTAAFNASGKPEPVLTNDQWQAIKRNVVDKSAKNEYTIKVEVADTNASPDLIARKVMTEIQKRESARGLSRKIGED